MNLPFADFIGANMQMIKYLCSILIIILLIVALSAGGVSGAGTYFYLITAIILEVVAVGLPMLYRQ